MAKTIAIIGAGASGLPSIRHALLHGFDVVCYEAQDDIGGLWRYRAEDTEEACVMKSTVINTSKELTAYSDFPPPPEEANYMHNTRMQVLNIERAADYKETGRWKLTVCDRRTSITTSTIFDCVLLCIGRFAKPHIPPAWPGQEAFKGDVTHVHDYKDHRGYEDKTAVVVGIGNSGSDLAVELSRVCKQVYLVSRRGSWIFNRVGDYGMPSDCLTNSRAFHLVKQIVPFRFIERSVLARLNKRFDHEQYGLKPKHGLAGALPTTNDELPNRLISGTVRVKPEIARFSGDHSITFADGTIVNDVDSVVLATGYDIGFPFVEDGNLINVHDNEVDGVYKYIFPQTGGHDTLAIIGLVQPLGSVTAVAEMQVRVALAAMSGMVTLPPPDERLADFASKMAAIERRYVKSRRHTVQVDYIPYMDELAEMIGCVPPSPASLLLSDPVLAAHVLLAPHAAYFYRLRGPHSWPGARAAILGIQDRIVKATNQEMSGSIFSMHNAPFALLLGYFQCGVVLFICFLAAAYALLSWVH